MKEKRLILMVRLHPISGNSSGPENSVRMLSKAIPACLALFFLATLICQPALAHSAAQMGVAPDQYDKGIPVYWPYHALFMSAGFGLLLTGFVIMRVRKTPDKYRIHQILQTTGGGSILAGLAIGVFMVSLSGAPQFRYEHDIIGAGIVILAALTLAIGYVVNRGIATQPAYRKSHRWLGRTSMALMAVNIFLGITMMAMVLAQ